MRLYSLRLLLVPLIILIGISVLSQAGKPWEELKKACELALHQREEALALAYSAHYNERREEQLNTKALNGLRAVLPALETNPLAGADMLFRVYQATGELEHYFGNTDSALAYYKKAIGLMHKKELADSLFFRPLLYAGLIHYGRGHIDSAALVFLKADSIQQRYGTALEESQRLYNTLGVLDYEAGNYRQARNFFTKALERIDRNDPFSLDLESNYLINLAQAEAKLGEYDEALASYGQILHMGRNTNEIRHNMALIHLEKAEAPKALKVLAGVTLEGSKQAQLHNTWARALLMLNDTMRARQHLDSALLVLATSGTDISTLGNTNMLLGKLGMARGDEDQAILYFSEAIHYFYPSFNTTYADSVPQTFSGIFAYISLYEALVSKAQAYHAAWQKNKSTRLADMELQCYQGAYKLLDHVMDTYESDDARLFITRSRNASHDAPISIAYDLYKATGDRKYLEALYHIDQQNKASVLALNVINASGNDPRQLEASRIKKQITRLSLSRMADSTATSRLNKEIMELELRLAQLKDRSQGLQRSWQKIPALKDLQQMLDKRSVIVSYHLSGNILTTTTISAEALHADRRILPQNFWPMLQWALRAYRDPATVPASSYPLYRILFPDLDAMLPSRVIIVPDNELHYLPFEVLQDSAGRFAIEKFSIQYQYSTAFLKKEGKGADMKDMLSFAPFASAGAEGFAALPSSLEETSGNPGIVLVDRKASREEFLKRAGLSGTIHLATHATAGPASGSSYLVFKGPHGMPELLYGDEIYNLDLRKNDLVILSACETASGDLLKGEGVMSLSRAFTYAGSRNIVTTLWKADDRSTAYLSTRFLGYLKKGYPKDLALQQAKLDLLKDPKIHPRNKHPYYWAHFIFIGNYTPAGKLVSPLVVVAILIIAGIAGWLVKKKFLSGS